MQILVFGVRNENRRHSGGMKRLLLLLPALVFAIPVAANPFLPEVNQSLIAQRGYDWEEEEEKEEKKTISSDVKSRGSTPRIFYLTHQ